MAKKPDPVVEALGTIYSTLEPLDPEQRDRVLRSVASLLGNEQPLPASIGSAATPQTPTLSPPPVVSGAGKRISLNEMIIEKRPTSVPQFIILFAFYREKIEGQPRFARAELRKYFGKASEPPPSNFDRDFVRAVKLGWLHEDEDESYITSKGLEAVEAGFDGRRIPRGVAAPRKRRKSTKKKTKKTDNRKRQVKSKAR